MPHVGEAVVLVDERFKRQLAEAKEIVEEEIEGLQRLVDTFRMLGQLPKVEKAPIALAELIEELRLDPTFAAKLELHAPTEPVTVLLLKRVLANLVENGIHAGEEAGNDGKVAVAWRAERAGDSVSITFDDHGKGVAAADRDKIFEPYVTTKSQGTGLGPRDRAQDRHRTSRRARPRSGQGTNGRRALRRHVAAARSRRLARLRSRRSSLLLRAERHDSDRREAGCEQWCHA